MKRLAKAARLIWWALRNRDDYDAVVAWRIAKSEVWPTTYIDFNLDAPTTTSTTVWWGHTLNTRNVPNPFYTMQRNYLDSESEEA